MERGPRATARGGGETALPSHGGAGPAVRGGGWGGVVGDPPENPRAAHPDACVRGEGGVITACEWLGGALCGAGLRAALREAVVGGWRGCSSGWGNRPERQRGAAAAAVAGRRGVEGGAAISERSRRVCVGGGGSGPGLGPGGELEGRGDRGGGSGVGPAAAPPRAAAEWRAEPRASEGGLGTEKGAQPLPARP